MTVIKLEFRTPIVPLGPLWPSCVSHNYYIPCLEYSMKFFRIIHIPRLRQERGLAMIQVTILVQEAAMEAWEVGAA